MRTRTTIFCASLLCVCACQTQELDTAYDAPSLRTETKQVIITAGLEDEGPATRTELEVTNPGTQNATYQSFWVPGDQITIFSAGQGSVFTSQNTTLTKTADFLGEGTFVISGGVEGSSADDYIWGVYPSRPDIVYTVPSGETSATAVIQTELPSFQTGKAGSFADDLAIMIGRSKGSLSMPFKSAYSGLWVKIGGNDVVSMTLRGNRGETLAGRATFGLNSSTLLPEVKSFDDPKTEITLSPPSGGTFEAGQFYYFITLPNVSVDGGYSITVRKTDGTEGTFTLTSSREFKRNAFLGVSGTVDTRATDWHAASTQGLNEIWYTTTDGSAVGYHGTGNPTNIAPDDNNGIGILRFNSTVTQIPANALYLNTKMLSVSLPESVETIGIQAFSNCTQLQQVALPDNLQRIEDSAFNECTALQQISLPKGLKFIGRYAFSNAPLAAIDFPSGLETIGYRAFEYAAFQQVTIPQSVQSLGMNPFFRNSSLTEFRGKFASDDGKCLVVEENNDKRLISFASGGMEGRTYVFPADITVIEHSACFGATFSHIVLPEGLKTIKNMAIRNCPNLLDLTIPASVESIGNHAFPACTALQWIKIEGDKEVIRAVAYDDLSYDDSYGIFNNTGECPIYVPSNLLEYYKVSQHWDEYASRYRAQQPDNEIWFTLTEGASPDNLDFSVFELVDHHHYDAVWDEGKEMYVVELNYPLTSFPSAPFWQCHILKSIMLPDSVTEIEEEAFYDCQNLESVQLGKNVTTIGAGAFKFCYDLTSIVLPEGLTSLGEQAFFGSGITSINIPESLSTNNFGSQAFNSCQSLTSFTGRHVSADGRCLLSGNNDSELFCFAPGGLAGQTYRIPEGIESIKDMNGATFRSVYLPNTVETIGESSFSACENLQYVSIPASVRSIAQRAFEFCTQLVQVGFDSATPPILGYAAFENTNNTYVLAIPGAGASTYPTRTNWSELTNHFRYYQTDKEIWYHLNDDSNGDIQLNGADFGANWTGNVTITIGANGPLVGIAGSVPSELDNATTFVVCAFDDRITRVPADAFSPLVSGSGNNNKIDWLSLPNYVSEIGPRAFKGCSNLLIYPVASNNYEISTIGEEAFQDCTSLVGCYNERNTVRILFVTSIGARAFQGCTAMSKLRIPSSSPVGPASVGNGAFHNCTSLTMALLDGVSEIGSQAFYGCENLRDMSLQRLVNITGDQAFRSITMNELKLPAIQQLPMYTFSESAIGEIHFGPDLGVVSNYIFYNAQTPVSRELYFEGTTTLPFFSPNSFMTQIGGTTPLPLTKIHVPQGYADAYKALLHNANSAYDTYYSIIVDDL